jgi:hypothetical protein
MIGPLLPLLDERTLLKEPSLWRVCDGSARTIATLLEWKDSIAEETDPEARDALIAKIKTRAEEAHQGDSGKLR